MKWMQMYEKWLQFTDLQTEMREEIVALEQDKAELEDCFYRTLAFGTGGMRGKIGVGPNRMNKYTVRRAAAGLGQYMLAGSEFGERQGVVIAYDSRHHSFDFALETAKTVGALGIRTYLFEGIRSTPELSFAVRYLSAFSGVVITASHNPATYNGFKAYGSDGAQFAAAEADRLAGFVEAQNEKEIPVVCEKELVRTGLLTIIGEEVDNAYQAQLECIIQDPNMLKHAAKELQIVYTPLHGSGYVPVKRALSSAGFTDVQIVRAQAFPDGDFPTVESPNPEEASAFAMAVEKGKTYNADLLLATDPDADRVGVAVKANNKYQLLTGNQIGAILLHYIIQVRMQKKDLPVDSTVLKTIVTSDLGRAIARAHNITVVDVLTGFKYISAEIRIFEEKGSGSFLFGYEESYGYLISDFVRDKDAMQACLLTAEVAAYYKKSGKGLLDLLEELYQAYGYYKEDIVSLTLEGQQGVARINRILKHFRKCASTELNGNKILITEDYLSGIRTHHDTGDCETITLPISNVLKYKLENDAWVCLRPSGTEPKIKIYFGVKGTSAEESNHLLSTLKKTVMQLVKAKD